MKPTFVGFVSRISFIGPFICRLLGIKRGFSTLVATEV